MKLGRLVSPAFAESLKTLMKMTSVPPRTAFAIRGIAKVITEECTKYDEMRKQYIEEFSVPRTDGLDGVQIDPSRVKEFNFKMKELHDIEVELKEIKFSDLGSEVNLSIENLFHLEFIVE